MQQLHALNILIHVVCGGLALALGLVPLVATKGGALHVRFGRWYVALAAVVLTTAVVGIGLFRTFAFLTAVTLAAVYEVASGWRTLRTRASGPALGDGLLAALALGIAIALGVTLASSAMPWPIAMVGAAVGMLGVVALYDLTRFLWPRHWHARLWPLDHGLKMIAGYSALLSAFSGTVLDAWQPWSQFMPSVLGTLAVMAFGWRYRPGSERHAALMDRTARIAARQ